MTSTTSQTPAERPLRILLIDDDVLVREAISKLLQPRAGSMVVGETGDRNEALGIAAREKPDIILLGLNLGLDGTGQHFLPELLSAAGAGARVLLLTGVVDPEAHYQAVRLGAMGVVLKGQAVDVLLKAIQKVHAGEAWLNRTLIANLITRIARTDEQKKIDAEADKIESLTRREREVASLVGEGLKNQEIGDRLFISETTVRHHLTTIFSKLDISNRFELILFLYRHKTVRPPFI